MRALLSEILDPSYLTLSEVHALSPRSVWRKRSQNNFPPDVARGRARGNLWLNMD